MTQEKIKSYNNIKEALANYQVRYETEPKIWWTFINYKDRVIYSQAEKDPTKNKNELAKQLVKLEIEAQKWDN